MTSETDNKVEAVRSGDNYDVSKCPAPIFGRAVTHDHMIHGLCYILRQIEGCNHYRPNIGQSESATSALRMALALLIPTEQALASLDRTAPESAEHCEMCGAGRGLGFRCPRCAETNAPAQEVAGLVEKVARIIDPEIFKSLEAQAGFPPESVERHQNKRVSEALDKARDVIALASSPSQGGERS